MGSQIRLHAAIISSLALIAACGSSTQVTTSDAIPSSPSDSPSPATTESWRDPVPAPAAPKNMPPAGSPLFFAAAAEEFVYGQGRGLDQQTNLDYLRRTAPLVPDFIAKGEPFEHPFWHDPYVVDWGSTQGQINDVVILNRYGAHLNARLYGPKLPFTDPVSHRTTSGPFPTLIFIPGSGGVSADSSNDHFSSYEGALEQIVEHGYVVLAVNPQGQGGSETFTPPSPYCDPSGSWTQPQELGLVEQGPCAGQEGPSPPYSGNYEAAYSILQHIPLGAFLAQTKLEPQAALADTVLLYDGFRTRFVFPAFDAMSWLASSQNPWRNEVDIDRVGIVGHSAGADAAVVTGNGDAAHRFKAAVAWDTHGLPPDTVLPSVPTLLMRTTLQGEMGPYVEPPHDEYFAAYRIGRRFVKDRIPAMSITLRGSSHGECAYLPYALLDPLTSGPLGNVSSTGGLVNLYYTIAWFDRWLKGGTSARPSGDEAAQRDDARARLLTRTFDDSADRTSFGQGTGPLQNQPYRISGDSVEEHLSAFLHSEVAFDGVTCDDWQAGC